MRKPPLSKVEVTTAGSARNNPNLRIINPELNIDELGCCRWKHSAFTAHKGDHKVFVETGTHIGYGVMNAVGCNFDLIYSVEYLESNFKQASQRWKDVEHVHLFLGKSAVTLQEKILPNINEPVFFWLDAHIPPAISGKLYDQVLMQELDVIATHPIKEHTILVDDMSNFDRTKVENKIRDINKNYVFTYEPTPRSPNEILVAKI